MSGIVESRTQESSSAEGPDKPLWALGYFNRVATAHKFILKTLNLHSAFPEDVLTRFCTVKPWPIPPRHTGIPAVDNHRLKASIYNVAPEEVVALFKEVMPFIKYEGLGARARAYIKAVLGKQVFEDGLFTPFQVPTAEAVARFEAEFALAVSNLPGRLITLGNSCYMRIRVRGNTSYPVGLTDRTRSSRPVWLQKMIHDEQGTESFDSFDVIDKLRDWAEDTLKGRDLTIFVYVLYTLKRLKSANITVGTEQMVWKMQVKSDDSDVSDPLTAMLYTKEALAQIKSIWTDNPSWKAYQELYVYLVPTYLEHKTWLELFQIDLLPEDEFRFEHVELIDSRLPVFMAHFQRIKYRFDRKI